MARKASKQDTHGTITVPSTFKNKVYHAVYPLSFQPMKRDRPMKVLVLGLSRTGTDSLRSALLALGYRGVYHGFVTAMNPEQSIFWTSALEAKWRGQVLTAADFDTVLGEFEAMSDSPANCFGPELLAAYPDAKVIVNRRKDIDAWHASIKASIFKLFENPFLIACSRFSSRLFWLWQVHELSFGHRVKGDFDKHGKEFYIDHYAELDHILKKSGRPYLNWHIEDGWDPLCSFLARGIPDVAFPRGNSVGKEFNDRAGEYIGSLVRAATLRMAVTATIVVGLIAVSWRRL